MNLLFKSQIFMLSRRMNVIKKGEGDINLLHANGASGNDDDVKMFNGMNVKNGLKFVS